MHTWISLSSLKRALERGPGIAVFTLGPDGSPGTKLAADANPLIPAKNIT